MSGPYSYFFIMSYNFFGPILAPEIKALMTEKNSNTIF